MGAVDPTYPLFPIASILAAVLLLLVLLASFLRHTWNTGVAFLCFWLFVGNVFSAANAIIWSDNADVKLYAYCDIGGSLTAQLKVAVLSTLLLELVSHVDVIISVVKPMATLLITRQLHLIAGLRSLERLSKGAKRRALAVEWGLGFVFPLVVAGPIYYVHQGFRFEVDEGFGCTSAIQISVLEILTIGIWSILPPLISVIFYYPKVLRTFYCQIRDIDHSLSGTGSLSRANYLRIVVLASIDLLLTLPVGIANIILGIISWRRNFSLPFYWGWTYLHAGWEPLSVSYADFQASGTANFALYYFNSWTSPFLAYVIFCLFGLSSEARASYKHVFDTLWVVVRAGEQDGIRHMVRFRWERSSLLAGGRRKAHWMLLMRNHDSVLQAFLGAMRSPATQKWEGKSGTSHGKFILCTLRAV
ncbi:unnamed protein product [Peniophora sp. CBMAI 1063]|nr:unnamed protein product [Peniophora sp. CBMAI 1063]